MSYVLYGILVVLVAILIGLWVALICEWRNP